MPIAIAMVASERIRSNLLDAEEPHFLLGNLSQVDLDRDALADIEYWVNKPWLQTAIAAPGWESSLRQPGSHALKGLMMLIELPPLALQEWMCVGKRLERGLELAVLQVRERLERGLDFLGPKGRTMDLKAQK